MCVCMFVSVCVCVWACLLHVLVSRQRSSSSICTPATPATASERPFLVVVVAFDLSCASFGIWARFLQVQLLPVCLLLGEMRLSRNQFLSKAEPTRYTCPITDYPHFTGWPINQVSHPTHTHIHWHAHKLGFLKRILILASFAVLQVLKQPAAPATWGGEKSIKLSSVLPLLLLLLLPNGGGGRRRGSGGGDVE